MRAFAQKIVRTALAAVVAVAPALAVPAAVSLPPPPDLDVRLVGISSFQQRFTVYIEDLNTKDYAFYRVGDPIYGYEITTIESGGIELTKGGRKYYLALRMEVVKAAPAESVARAIEPNTYLPTADALKIAASAAQRTQWDRYFTDAPPRPTGPGMTDVGGRFAMPLRLYKRLSSGYGYRVHPLGGGSKMHNGIDLAASPGTPIHAAADGTIVWSGWRGGYGYCVIIDHHNGFTTTYGHCSKLLLEAGDNVQRGEMIAEVGSTGASTGPHLHFEVRYNNMPQDPIKSLKGF